MTVQANFAFMPSSSGVGGQLHYQHATETTGTVTAGSGVTYWDRAQTFPAGVDREEREATLRALRAASDFISLGNVLMTS